MATKTRKSEPKRKPTRDFSISPARQAAESLLASFPKAATQTLAKRAYRENGALWPTFNACYLMFRKLRGQQGQKNRASVSAKEHYRPAVETRISFPTLPEGLRHIDDFQPVKLDLVGNWLVISDLHIPYHDTPAIRAALSEARRRNVVGILLNGDVADCFAVSRWEKDPRKRNFPEEIAMLRQFFGALREAFPKAQIVWKAGNHEQRLTSYLMTKAPELLGLECLNLDSLTGADNLGVQYVDDNRPVKIGELWTLHGHEYKFNISNPVNPARGIYLRTKVSTLIGHLHQSSSHTEPNLDGHLITCWSIGMLCDPHPDYSPLNKWNAGFANVEVSAGGAFEVDNMRYVKGRMWR